MSKNASPASDHQNGLGGRRGLMLVLSSPSGAGKTSISRRLLAEDDDLEAEEDPDYIQQIAAYVDQRMHEVPGSSTTRSLASVAILTAVRIADELHKEREGRVEQDKSLSSLDEKIIALIQRMDQVLDHPASPSVVQ